jgi:putative transposase
LSHAWSSSGEKRTIWWYYEPSGQIVDYLKDMRDAVHYGLLKAEELRRTNGKIPSPIDLRREIKPWFDSTYGYAKHHINPVCRSAVAILRSFRKNRNGKKYPEARKLSMRLDSELVKLQDGFIRITIRPQEYEYIPVNGKHAKYSEYSQYRISELLLTDRKVVLSFTKPDQKEIREKKIGMDVNFRNLSMTVINDGKIEKVMEESTSNIVKIQNDYSRRRKKIQKHIRNPQKRRRILKETRGRQTNRVKDDLHKTSAKLVDENPDATFVVEDLTNIRKTSHPYGEKLRTYLNRWPYAEFLRMLEYKSPNRVIKVNPGGTSSECPVCGEKVKHPTWKMSRCENCDRDYDRDRLASLAISLRGLDLCGDPFPVSAVTSVPSVMDEYLYVRKQPGLSGAGSTEAAYVPNKVVHKIA